MDPNERDYLRGQIEELRRANRRWKTLTILVSTAFAIFLIVQAVAVLGHGVFSLPLMREAERARMEADLARMEAERMYAVKIALEQARQAELQAGKLAAALDEAPELLGYPTPERVEPADANRQDGSR